MFEFEKIYHSGGQINEVLIDRNGSSIIKINGDVVRRTLHRSFWEDNILYPVYIFCCWNCEPTTNFDILIRRPGKSMAMRCRKCGFVEYHVND